MIVYSVLLGLTCVLAAQCLSTIWALVILRTQAKVLQSIEERLQALVANHSPQQAPLRASQPDDGAATTVHQVDQESATRQIAQEELERIVQAAEAAFHRYVGQ